MLLGAGIGLILPSLSAASVGGVPAERYGAAAALHQTVRQLGSVIGVAIAVTLLGGLGDGARFDRVFVWLMASGVLLAGAAPLLRESTT
jgi:low temperature requirement protein LtrA